MAAFIEQFRATCTAAEAIGRVQARLDPESRWRWADESQGVFCIAGRETMYRVRLDNGNWVVERLTMKEQKQLLPNGPVEPAATLRKEIAVAYAGQYGVQCGPLAQYVGDAILDRTDHVWLHLGASWKCVLCGGITRNPPNYPTPADWSVDGYELPLTPAERAMCPYRAKAA